jgi:hypothetical protein
MLPTTGSRITAAIVPGAPAKRRFTAEASLKGSTMVSAAAPRGTPGESGKPSVATPDPA